MLISICQAMSVSRKLPVRKKSVSSAIAGTVLGFHAQSTRIIYLRFKPAASHILTAALDKRSS
jgi:hypothetical protein